MKKKAIIGVILFVVIVAILKSHSDGNASPTSSKDLQQNTSYNAPQAVTISGYDGSAMEPFLTRDGEYLIFNNSNDAAVNTNLHYAKKIDATHFTYIEEVKGVNGALLDAVASVDHAGNFYFTSTRSYADDLESIYTGKWKDGEVTDVMAVRGISKKEAYAVIMDSEINDSGDTLYLSDAVFKGKAYPESSNITMARKTGDAKFDRLDASLTSKINKLEGIKYAPATRLDGKELYFSTLVFKGRDVVSSLYVSKRTGAASPFQKPDLILAKKGLIEGPTVATNGDVYYHECKGVKCSIKILTKK